MRKLFERYYPGELAKAEARAFGTAEAEFGRKLDRALQEQRGEYELKIAQLNSEIGILNTIIDQRKYRLDEAIEKELTAKSVLLKAQEIINQVEYEFRQHVENNTRTMVRFKEIRSQTEDFSRQLLPQT